MLGAVSVSLVGFVIWSFAAMFMRWKVDSPYLDQAVAREQKDRGLGVLWYEGSDDEFHYVTHVFGKPGQARYKVRRDDFDVSMPFRHTTDSKHWKLLKHHGDPWPLPKPLEFRN